MAESISPVRLGRTKPLKYFLHQLDQPRGSGGRDNVI